MTNADVAMLVLCFISLPTSQPKCWLISTKVQLWAYGITHYQQSYLRKQWLISAYINNFVCWLCMCQGLPMTSYLFLDMTWYSAPPATIALHCSSCRHFADNAYVIFY